MMDKKNFEITKADLRYCPHCAAKLDQHPNNVNTLSCYLHGDFLLVWKDGCLIIRWHPTRMGRFYIQGPPEEKNIKIEPARTLDGPL